MRLSNLRRFATLLAGIGLLGFAGISFGDDGSQAPKSPQPMTAAPEPPAASTPSVSDPLAAQVDEAIRVNAHRFLETDVQTPWQLIHGLLAYRRDYVVKEHGNKVNALEWIASRATFHGEPWFQKMPYGAHAHPFNGRPYEFQGHPCQFMACMTMCDLPRRFQIQGGRRRCCHAQRPDSWCASRGQRARGSHLGAVVSGPLSRFRCAVDQ